jgi:uncharacterized membrane protein YbhN (UPF0104 family)
MASIVGLVLAVAIGVGAIRLLTEVDPWPVLQSMDVPLLLLAVSIFIFGNLLVGHRFLAMHPERSSASDKPWEVGSLIFAASTFSLVFPGPVGELAAVAAMKKRYGLDPLIALATSVHSRLVGLAAAALVAMAALPFVAIQTELGEILRIGAVLLVFVGLALGVMSSNPKWVRRFGQMLNSGAQRGGPLGKALSGVAVFSSALARVGRAPLSTWFKVLGWSMLIQGVQMMALICVAAAMSIAPEWPGIVLAQGTGSLAILVGIFLPGGLATYEIAFVSSMVGPGMVTGAAAGILVVGMRIVHLLGLSAAGLMFALWAKVLMSEDVVAGFQELNGSKAG